MIVEDRIKLAHIGLDDVVSKSFNDLEDPEKSTYLSPEAANNKLFSFAMDVW